jgi:hypothetical protein
MMTREEIPGVNGKDASAIFSNMTCDSFWRPDDMSGRSKTERNQTLLEEMKENQRSFND